MSVQNHIHWEMLFQRCGPASVKDWSPRLIRVLGTLHLATLDDWSLRQLVVVISCICGYYGDRPFSALWTWMASLNSICYHTGSEWSCLKTGTVCSCWHVCTACRHQVRLYLSNVCTSGSCLCVSVSRYVSAVHQLPVSAAEHWWARQATARHSQSTHHVSHSHRSGICSLEDCICQLDLGE